MFFSYVSSDCGFFFFKQKTAYEMRISDWSSDVCSSDLKADGRGGLAGDSGFLSFDNNNNPIFFTGSTPGGAGGRGTGGSATMLIDVDPLFASLTVRADGIGGTGGSGGRSEEHTSEIQSLMRSTNAVFCLTKKK